MGEPRTRKVLFAAASLFLSPIEALAVPLYADAVGYWRLGDGSGTVAVDSGTGGRNGTLTNMDPATDWVAGRVGGALDFDGSDDKVVVPDDEILEIGSSLTLAAWFKLDTVPSASAVAGRWLSGSLAWQLQATPGGMYFFVSSNGSNNNFVAGTTAIAASTWYYVVATFDAGTAGMYVNGAWQRTATGLPSSIYTSGGADLTIGQTGDENFNNRNPLDGVIDEVAIWARALSPSEIATLYNGGAGYASGARAVDLAGGSGALNGVTIQFADAWPGGSTSLDRTTTAPEGANLSGLSYLPSFWDVTNSVDFDAAAGYDISIQYDPAAIPNGLAEAALRLYHIDGGGTVQDWTSSIDTATNVIQGHGTSFSPFFIGGPLGQGSEVPEPGSLALVALGLLGALFTLRPRTSGKNGGMVSTARMLGCALGALLFGGSAEATTIALWGFNEGSGSAANDLSDNANTLELTGAAPFFSAESPAFFEGGTSLDARNAQGAAAGSGILMSLGSHATLEAWVKVEAPPSSAQTFRGVVGKTGPGVAQPYWLLLENGDHGGYADRWQVEYIFTDADGTRRHNQSSGVFIPPSLVDTWVHIAVTYDGTTPGTATVVLYVNGVGTTFTSNYGNDINSGAYEAVSGNLLSTTEDLLVGSTSPGAFLIDEIRISDTTRVPGTGSGLGNELAFNANLAPMASQSEVPEPGSLGMGLAAAGMTLLWRARRRRGPSCV